MWNDNLGLHDKSVHETVHAIYCKAVLGRIKLPCHITPLCELDRLSVSSVIKTQVMVYFVLLNSQNINPLIKDSYDMNMSLPEKGFFSIFKEMNLNTNDYKNMLDTKFVNIRNSVKKQLKNPVLDTCNYKNKTMEELSEFTEWTFYNVIWMYNLGIFL